MLLIVALLLGFCPTLFGAICVPGENLWRLGSDICSVVEICCDEITSIYDCIINRELCSVVEACCGEVTSIYDCVINQQMCQTMTACCAQIDCAFGTTITQAMMPYTISESGVYYVCEALMASGAPTISITADNVTLNLNGFTVTSIDNVGINSTGSGVTLTNGYVVAAETALNFTAGTNITVTNIQSSSSIINGPSQHLFTVNNLQMRDCIINGNGLSNTLGLFISGDSIYLTNVSVINTGDNYGFQLGPITTVCELVNCLGVNISNHAFAFENINVLRVRGCTAIGSDNGFAIFGGTAPVFEDCVAQSNSFAGFWLQTGGVGSGVTGAVFKDCITDTNVFGFICDGASTDTVYEGCVANNNTNSGFWMRDGTFTACNHCLASSNAANGFQIDNLSSRTIITDCIAENNAIGITNAGTGTYIVDTRSSNPNNTTLNLAYSLNGADDILGGATVITIS